MEEENIIEFDKYREFCVLEVGKGRFIGNQIHTTKYNIFTFIFQFLYEQFRKLPNLFFLFMALIQQIPGVSPVGRYITLIPLTIILSVSTIKEIFEDINRARNDSITNNQQCAVYQDGWHSNRWRDISVGNIIKIHSDETFPADVIVIATSESSQLCYIQTASLDGETNYKIKKVTEQFSTYYKEDHWKDTKVKIKCENPNSNLYQFNGIVNISDSIFFRIDNDQVILRGSHLKNTHWAVGIVVYTGNESKIMQNSSKSKLKMSYITKKTNIYIFIMIVFLLVISIFFALIYEKILTRVMLNHWYFNLTEKTHITFHISLLTSFILFHNIIPVSLVITIELTRTIQSYFIVKDPDLQSECSDGGASVKNSNVIEDFGIVNYLFTDKTGTLTCNTMTLKQISILSHKYSLDSKSDREILIKSLADNPSVKMYIITLLLCNTVLVESDENGQDRLYQSTSPDELAIIRALERYGYIFQKRNGSLVHILINGVEEDWTILQILDFNSNRMRMSVVVKSFDNKIYLLVKGADNAIAERLKIKNDATYNSTMIYLEEFSRDGLRTLCIGYKEYSAEEYKNLSESFEKSSKQVLNSELLLSQISKDYETDLILLGCTGIEDKLQDHVPEAIRSLKEAKIHIWMCTGDKLQTAVNIGYSCGLLNTEMDVRILSCDSVDSCLIFLKSLILEKEIPIYETKCRLNPPLRLNLALVFTGKDLIFAQDKICINKFIDVLIHCESVICCRLSPLQKKNIVLMIREAVKDTVTLAVGDGVNDCSMIQAAHVGVGIHGKEGTQAASCSDISIREFNHLAKLLFIHGSDTFRRLSNCILYVIYKSIALNVIHMLYYFYCMNSSLNIFNRFHLSVFNTIYTSLPAFCFGLLEEYCSRKARYNLPYLYNRVRTSKYFGFRRFFGCFFNGILHSMLIFFLCYYLCKGGSINPDGTTISLPMLGTIILTNTLLAITLKAALEIRCWSLFVHIGIWGGLITYILCNILICRRVPLIIWMEPYFLDSDILLFKSYIFWMTMLLPIVVLLPDFLYHAVRNTWFPPSYIVVREFERYQMIDWNIFESVDQMKTKLVKSTESKTLRRHKYFGFAFSLADNIKGKIFTKSSLLSQNPKILGPEDIKNL